jgi:hypothetical protein
LPPGAQLIIDDLLAKSLRLKQESESLQKLATELAEIFSTAVPPKDPYISN